MAASHILFDLPRGMEPVDRAILEDPVTKSRYVTCHPRGLSAPSSQMKVAPLAEGAHGIVLEFDLDRPQHRAILDKYKTSLGSDLPIRVVARPDQVARQPWRDCIRGTGRPLPATSMQ